MADIDWEAVYERYQLAVHDASEPSGATHDDGCRRPAARRAPRRRVRAGDQTIPGAPGATRPWSATGAAELPTDRDIVVYCVYGHEVGRATALRLRARDCSARYLRGGIDGWQAAGRPLVRQRSLIMKWVTRERPKIDRIACPWLILRFIDREAEFLYVPAPKCCAWPPRRGATPYDIPGVEMSHVGELCSFDAFLGQVPADRPGAGSSWPLIVRGADTSRLDLTPQSAGLYAISLGLSRVFADDHEMLRHGLVMYDALYAWCREGRDETHSWPPAMQ